MNRLIILLLLCLLGNSSIAFAYGPYDYINPMHRQKYLPIVEEFHFNANVRNLVHGQSDTLYGDLQYVLYAFPNHHPALNAMVRLYRRNHNSLPGSPPGTTPDKFFIRAIKFSPQDAVAYMLYGIYMHKMGRLDEAEKLYLKALEIAPDMAEINYNIGLLYTEKKDYKKASRYGQKAYSLHYPLPGLRDKLIRAGVWNEAVRVRKKQVSQ